MLYTSCFSSDGTQQLRLIIIAVRIFSHTNGFAFNNVFFFYFFCLNENLFRMS